MTLFGGLLFINVRGVARGARLVEVITVTKLVPLLTLVAVGVWFVHSDNLVWPALPSVPQVGRSAIVLIFAFLGVEVALVPSGEIADPARTVPRALMFALLTTTTLYLLVQGVAQGLLGSSLSAYAAAPLAEAARRVLGPAGGTLVLLGGTVSMLGYVSGDMLGSPRALFALGRDGALPAILARVHSRFHTPYVALIVHAVIVATLSISSSFAQLAVLSNVAALSLYLMCVAAAYELKRRHVGSGPAAFNLPGGAVVPLLAAVTIIWLLSQATWREFAVEALVLAGASAFYVIRKRITT